MSPEPPRIVSDVTCLACGCLCDDIIATVADGRIVSAERACERGRAWFLAGRPDGPPATIAGRPVSPTEALDRARTLLRSARCPVILGLAESSIEAQGAAIALADTLGATIDPDTPTEALHAAFARVGRVGATLGEVTMRADLVLYWYCDPVKSHPRHWERVLTPPGRFMPEGRAGRSVLAVAAAPNATSERADAFLPVPLGACFEVLTYLRALVRGIGLDTKAARISHGIEPEILRSWAERLKSARYAAVFFGVEPGPASILTALFRLVADLNAVTRCVAVPLGEPGNRAGVETVLAWQTGYPAAVDLAAGFPRYQPGEATAEARLVSGAADVALVVGSDPVGLTPAAREHLDRIPRVVIAPDATRPDRVATVGLACARTGLESGGTVVRADGLMLPLRSPLDPPYPTDRDWLISMV